MRLKSLDIKGFKSFADKTQVVLDNAVTGIVGPNGCGKSNIVDAIRWVIGENKIKNLRSDNLGDLVFNGSKARPAAGMAEVSLTFENTRNLLPTDFSSVTVSRKFYKSGESEYRLNDVACRLKDIHNLFLDTGVSNDTYAIIELGMVDDIIKDKDGSRRRMLELAAGISVYKARKKEATQKLESTQQDIDRIEDILFEIGNNMRTLEAQAKKAERYLQIKKDYKEISLELARVSLQEYNDKYQSLNNLLEQETDRKIKVEAEIAGDEAEIESRKVKLTGEEQELAREQRQFNELVNRIRNLENEKKLAAQHLQHLQGREQDLKSFIKNAELQMQQLKDLLRLSNQQIEKETVYFDELQGGLETIRLLVEGKKADFDRQRKDLDNSRQQLQSLQQEQFDAEKKSAVTDSSLNNLKRFILQAALDKNKRETQLAQLSQDKNAIQSELEKREKDWNSLQEKHTLLQQETLNLQEKVEKLREEELTEGRKLDARQNEHDLLKSLVDSLEGFPESIKHLKKNKNWNSKALLLSDTFSVEKKYRIAIETVLDQYLNYYVVENLEEALQAISLLEKDKKGKANFFLLDKLKDIQNNVTPCPEGFIQAVDVVERNSNFDILANHLLSNVLIAENSYSLKQDQLPEGFIYVSKDGHLLRGVQTLKGGSVGAFEGNKIGRAKNLSLLTEEIKALSEKVVAINQQKEEQQTALQSVKVQLRGIDLEQSRRELNQLQNRLENMKSRMEQILQLNKDSEEQLEKLQQQLTATQNDFSGYQETLMQFNEKLTAFKSHLKQSSEAFSSVEQAYNAASSELNNHHLLLTQQRGKVEKLKQEQNFRNGQLTDLEKQILKNQEQLKEVSDQISTTSGKLNFGNNELGELVEQKERDAKLLNDRDSTYHVARNEVMEHEQRISRQRRERDQAETLVNSLKEKLSEMKLQVAGMKERLQVEFKVQLEEILEQERTTELDIQEINAESERLKKRLENMGEVNPTAIEAFQEINIRYQFIQEQKKDLENAKATLLETISEVENTANTRFKETFEQVRENFIQVFKALFTEEDTADLRLTNPDDLAETGIEIYARPKGKRPSTLTQLSGGEKTLTSTAFLFAIYLIKPAPFCILDEVDAPLDDANVTKFTNMIRQFSDNSQFIIITHNKQTMAAVDVIYGVTMQEAGVSKLVPVDFRSLQ